MLRRPSLATLVLLLVVSACGDDDDAPAADAGADASHEVPPAIRADHALEATRVIVAEGGLLAVSVDDADADGTAEAAAELARGRAATTFSPAGCASADGQDATVVYHLSQCAGPFGLAQVSGTLQVDYRLAAAGGIGIHAGPSLLDVGEATLSVDADGVYKKSGAQRKLTVETHGSATSPKGLELAREGSYALSWDEGAACLNVDGSWTTTIGTVSTPTTLAELTICAGGCPQKGATLAFGAVTVEYQGGASATWSSEDGETGDVTLECE
jgi:hypothetical protein